MTKSIFHYPLSFFGLLFLIQWLLVCCHVQFSFTIPESKYVTVFNQIDKEREAEQRIKLTLEQQEKDTKHKG